MSETSHKFPEAPIIILETHDEFIRALDRLRALRGATGNSVAGLEATALDIAITRYLSNAGSAMAANPFPRPA